MTRTNAFLLFKEEVKNRVIEQFIEEYKNKSIDSKQINSMILETWKNLCIETKNIYKQRASFHNSELKSRLKTQKITQYFNLI